MPARTRILFVENRQQTRFWEALAIRFQEDGHSVSWLVQNPFFAPTVGHVVRIPLPRPSDIDLFAGSSTEFAAVAAGDRLVNHFGGTPAHYGYYAHRIERALDELQPDIVFGEPTLFHERLVIASSRRRGIPYVFPGTCRYPPGRFCFFAYDTLRTIGGSHEELSEADAAMLLDNIVRRRLLPEYMQTPDSPGRFLAFARKAANDTRIALSWMAGERFNAPSPLRKAWLQQHVRALRARWDNVASTRRCPREHFQLLFPLQMQPEANLDVWGRERRNQLLVLTELLGATDDDTIIVVKPNPKSKYELSPGLIDLVASHPRIYAVPHQTPMAPLFERADLIVTVTGTVAMEAVFSGKPVVVLSSNMHDLVPNARYVRDIPELRDIVGELRTQSLGSSAPDHSLAYMRHLVRTSHRGWITNPYSSPSCLSTANLQLVYTAMSHLVEDMPGTRMSALRAIGL